MATEEELNKQNQFQREFNRAQAESVGYARSLTEEIKDQLGVRSRLNESQRSELSLAREIQKSVAQNNVELGNTGKLQQAILRDSETLNRIDLEIQLQKQDLTSKGFKLATQIAEKQKEAYELQGKLFELERLAEEVKGNALAKVVEEYEIQSNKSAILEKQLKDLQETAYLANNITQAEIDKVAVLTQLSTLQQENLRQKGVEEELQKKINDEMGVTGAVVTGLGGIMQRLGLRSGIFNDAMTDAKNTMHKMAEENVRNEKSFSRMQIAAAGLTEILKSLTKALVDPAVLAGRIAKAFFTVDQALVEVTRQTGRTSANFASLNDRFASAVDVLRVAADITKEIGIDATSIFSNQDLGRIAEAKNLLGLSAEQAKNLALNARVSGNTLEGYQESIVASVNEYNGLNDSTIAHGQVLQDVLNTSADIAMSLGGDAGRITKAAVAARALGLELSKVDRIASSLMDFESSIQNELEAQLLTGNSINLAKSRELALNNKLGELATELGKQGVDGYKFAEMNRIQQESLSKALGMSREELGKALAIQMAQKGATEEAIAAARGMTVEQLRAASVQEKFNKLVEKLAQSFSPVLELLVPIVDNIASIAQPIAKGIAQVMKFASELGKFGPLLMGIGLLFSTQLIRPIMSLGGKIITGVFTKFGGAISKLGGPMSKITEKITNFTGSTNKVGKAAKGAGRSLGGFFKGIAKGLSSFKGAGPGLAVFAGFAAVATGAIIGIGFALRLAAPAIEAFGKVVTAAFSGLAELATSVFQGFKLLLDGLTLDKLAGLYALGPALLAASVGIAAFGSSMLFATPALALLGALAVYANPMSKLGVSLTTVAAGIGKIADSLRNLETEKLNELKDLVITTAFAAPAVAATGAITELISGITGASTEESSNKELLTEIKMLRAAVEAGGNVYMDGNKVGQAMVLASTKLS